jgi:hypothetical protein
MGQARLACMEEAELAKKGCMAVQLWVLTNAALNVSKKRHG